MGVCPFHDTPPCESKIKLSVIRILSLSFAPFWQYPLFLLYLNHVSAADRSACSAADFDVVCHLLGEFHFLGLVEGHCTPNSYCSCSCEQEGSYHSRTLIDVTLCFHNFLLFYFVCFLFPRFDNAKLGTTSSLFNLLLPFDSFFDATVAPFCNKSREHPPYLSQTRQFWEK